ncbi:MAG: molybdate ABC transporter substrate-binding protein [Hyphomicrobium sp.]|nr:molybdate ABC transporter substrate-binding protein [Hyphomicrobium sp.]MBN9267009.1 molybdate ABC transporter substrate-binding protein [Hyphomicrobium sp.]MBN9276287.1 molybdate ABC transporter substrate-binding protein [Hyphomicrobium sp.]ODT21636.1 MAG: molybdate ABC transporter substrate-binding protein [Hyphomicrobium sp. SCN 65-11]OJU26039.1 MAG: molybdate ABC transporter substrate-binding protein [Alphaproteobacteria bacterium 64-6]
MRARLSWLKLPMAALASVMIAATMSTAAHAAEVKVAVAANFTEAVKEIGALFEKATGHKPVFSFGPTGGLYNQVTQAAPFEVFVSADQATPAKAIAEGHAVAGTAFTYATGKLVLFSKTDGLNLGEQTLKDGKFTKIAIANPKTAPYGTAAVEVMQKLGVYDALKGKIVEGNNIAQTYQFVDTANAEVGFIAFAQIALKPGGSRWVVPANLHKTIAQDAVLLKTGANNDAAKAFIAFLKGPEARKVIEKYGYGFVD